MKRALAIASALLLLGFVLYWGGSGLLQRQPSEEAQKSGGMPETENVPSRTGASTWYRSPPAAGYRFRLMPPSGVEVDTTAVRDRVHVRFLYAGPNNEPPALTDGFSLTVSLRPTPPGTSLDSLVRREIEETRRAGGEVIGAIRSSRFHGRPARAWTQESVLGGPVDHRLVRLGEHATAGIAVSIVGRNTSRYARMVRTMLERLRFTRTGRADSAAAASDPKPIRVWLAFLRDPNGTPERGCDDVVLEPRWIRHPHSAGPSTPTLRLETALRTLLAIDTDSVDGHRHFLAQTNETLSLDSVRIEDGGVAKVYLKGRLTGLRGVCDNPRGRIQIEETALSLPTVGRVLLYLNGRPTDLTPDAAGKMK